MGVKGFVEGGITSIIAGCSTTLDLIKVRMQLQGERQFQPRRLGAAATHAANIHFPAPSAVAPPRVGPVAVGVKIIQQEGVAALFSGVSATVLRQTLYSTTQRISWRDQAAVGNPADVAMVRMQADAGSRWLNGTTTKAITASILRSVQRVILEGADEGQAQDPGDGRSFAAGFVAAVASRSSGRDQARVMNMKVEPGMAPPYNETLDCAMKTIKAEGPMALYKDSSLQSQGKDHSLLLFVTLEQVRKMLKDF
ncbi:hypothetical protein HAX54_038725 [Datura stramonium]|uniref:Uncharacterized protein n=1 Tax=Datura stramonium TaxID=4076 RepID=A0ABS8RNH2_DATST|nr:hypothetical protein [Datura stramonium]